MHDPYGDVDWGAVHRLHSVNHTHTFSPNRDADEWDRGAEGLDGQAVFESIYDSGIRHFALSNYYPSKPTYPLSRHFDPVPGDALGCPNAEHSLADGSGHYCTIGSYVQSSGHYGADWTVLFRDALDQLAYRDGGGIVVNHPERSALGVAALVERMDFDPRVLGIEVYNHRSERKPKYEGSGTAFDTWDDLLRTGRTVYGFFNPDFHSRWKPAPDWTETTRGRNVLLVPELTESAAARAYRRGRFYGALDGSGLTFERIDADTETVAVATNRAGRIEFVSDGETVSSSTGSAASYSRDGDETYVRIEAQDSTGERIFSQPIVYD